MNGEQNKWETGGQDSLAPAWLWTHLRLGGDPACSEDTHRLLEMQSLGRWTVAYEVTTKVVRVSGTEWMGTKDGCSHLPTWGRGRAAGVTKPV